MDNLTQRQMIVNHCRVHGSITNRDAVMIGIGSPTKRISELRSDPSYSVTTEDVPIYDGDGKRVSHYFRYTIKEKEKS